MASRPLPALTPCRVCENLGPVSNCTARGYVGLCRGLSLSPVTLPLSRRRFLSRVPVSSGPHSPGALDFSLSHTVCDLSGPSTRAFRMPGSCALPLPAAAPWEAITTPYSSKPPPPPGLCSGPCSAPQEAGSQALVRPRLCSALCPLAWSMTLSPCPHHHAALAEPEFPTALATSQLAWGMVCWTGPWPGL